MEDQKKKMKKYKFIKPDPSLHSNLMAFGFECGEGWYPIIEEALNRIESSIIGTPTEDIFEVLQIKEKLGGLRIYVNIYTYEINKIIEEAKDKAAQTCEVCGKPGKLREINHWYFTNCDEHYKKRLEEN